MPQRGIEEKGPGCWLIAGGLVGLWRRVATSGGGEAAGRATPRTSSMPRWGMARSAWQPGAAPAAADLPPANLLRRPSGTGTGRSRTREGARISKRPGSDDAAATGDRSRSALVVAPPRCTTTSRNPRVPRGFYGRTDGQFSSPPFRPFPFLCPKFPRPTRPHSRTAASCPPRGASAVRAWDISLGPFPLCVPSDRCGVSLRAPAIGAISENTAAIGRNAEKEGAEARTAYPLRRLSEFCIPLAAPRAPRWVRPRRPVFIVSLWSARHWRPHRHG